MRDQGLNEAIRAAGGVSALARKIGIAQPSVSAWSQVPADRVAMVEAVTGVAREILRPDLFARPAVGDGLDDTDLARARHYALLSALLARAPDADFLSRVAQLKGEATPLGVALAGLADAAARIGAAKVEREFFDLFIGLGRGELMPYASYYLTGFLHERPLARLRADLAALGIERADGQSEPEDHAAILCEILSGLAGGHFAAPPDAQRAMFEKHVAPWMERFFADLERAESADFYRHVGTVGRLFVEIETTAFALPS